MFLISLARRGRIAAVLAGALLIAPTLAEARPGGKGMGFGSRGARTQTQAAPTTTAPMGAQPVQRSTTQAPSPSTAAPMAGAGAAAQAARPSFARNMMMGIGAGLLGAGLFGLLSGSGFFSGLASLAGFFGLLLQIALIGGLVWLAVRFFRRRSEPQLAGAGAPLGRQGYEPQPRPSANFGGFGGGAAPAAARPAAKPIMFDPAPQDFDRFESLLREVQLAYGAEDQGRLRQFATEEMVGYFAEDLAENARKGLVDRISDVKLLRGDLAEAWREGPVDYVTVAMRFSLVNALTERATGRVVEGHASVPQEATELWTFVRERGGEWKLSAIQPAA